MPTVDFDKQMQNSWNGDGTLSATPAVVGMPKEDLAVPFCAIDIVDGETLFSTGTPYLAEYVVTFTAISTTRAAVKAIMERAIDVFDNALDRTNVNEGQIESLVRDGEPNVVQTQQNPPYFEGTVVYRARVNRQTASL